MKYFILFKLIYKLGINNIFLLTKYKFLKYIGYYKLRSEIYRCPVIKLDLKKINNLKNNLYDHKIISFADKILENKFKLFSYYIYKFDDNYLWNKDPFSKTSVKNNLHWSKIDFYEKLDIKNIWEMSRWQWLPILAMAWKMSSNKRYIEKINTLTENWSLNNPINKGLNWSCGQEVSIRIIHLFQGLHILKIYNQIEIDDNLSQFVLAHLRRIDLTLNYAKSQNNNHIISESAALYIGGNLLHNKYFAEKGRRNLEFFINKLVMDDGTFSQYSVNYHRLVLDTLNQVEIWRRELELKPFNKKLKNSCEKLIKWLLDFTDPHSGYCPNLGGNDGSYCYQYNVDSYRDFRPTLNLSSILFNSCILFNEKKLLNSINFLNPKVLVSFTFKDNIYKNSGIKFFQSGGFIKIFNKNSWSILRLPVFKYRPVNVDPLHFDLWFKGVNILRDSGSYSYNKDFSEMNKFQGIEGHNSVQFENKESMPRIGRFLWGNWLRLDRLETINSSEEEIKFVAGYKFKYGTHQRQIIFKKNNNLWQIIDNISSFKKNATLRWRLNDSNWKLQGNILSSKFGTIEINCTNSNFKLNLEKGYESLFYNKKSELLVLKICIFSEGQIKTTIKLN